MLLVAYLVNSLKTPSEQDELVECERFSLLVQ